MDPETRHARLVRAIERYRPIVDDWEALVDAMRRPRPACVWVHPFRVSSASAAELMRADGWELDAVAWRPGAFRLKRSAPSREPLGTRWWYAAGLAHAQEEASLVPVAALGPRPGDRVLDLCAAPGGKTASIALALRNRGTVVANDVRASRLRALRATLDRLGIVNVSVLRHDGSSLPGTVGAFDRVLVDAPCSGEGSLRDRARIGRPIDGARAREHARRQRALLGKALQLCRPGGRVVYATCTMAPEENEAVVDAVLREGPRSGRIVPIEIPGLRRSPAVPEWDGTRFDEGLRHAVRIWPHDLDGGAFFVAAIEKEGHEPGARRARRELESADAGPLVRALDRFGIPEDALEPLRVFRANADGLHVVARGHEVPDLDTEGVGTFAIKTRIAYPKVSTACVQMLGALAVRNVVELDLAAARRYLARETVALSASRAIGVTETGYVVVRHRGFPLGVGFHDAATAEIRSMFPKRWTRSSFA